MFSMDRLMDMFFKKKKEKVADIERMQAAERKRQRKADKRACRKKNKAP